MRKKKVEIKVASSMNHLEKYEKLYIEKQADPLKIAEDLAED